MSSYLGWMFLFFWFLQILFLYTVVDVTNSLFFILLIFTVIIGILSGILNSELNKQEE
jgi:hypothetical protein